MFYQEANAGSVGGTTKSTGIVIGGTYKPVGNDPPYDYIFDVKLDIGATISNGESFTVENLIGVTPNNFPNSGDFGSSSNILSNYPWLGGGAAFSPVLSPPTSTTFPYASNVEWVYNGSTLTNNGSSSIDLGSFLVETTVNFTGSPGPVFPYYPGYVINFTTTINGSNGASGSFMFEPVGGVPEPSSAILLLIGAAGLPVWVLRKRQQVA
jgi:hypothetical protein